MRIANLIRRLAFDEWGGTETAVWNSVRILRADGYDADILATKALCSTPEETRDGVHIRRFDYFYPHLFLREGAARALDKKGGNPFSFGLYRALRDGGYDLIHTHAMGRLAKLARRAARARGIPYVVSFHGGQYAVPASEFEEMAKPLKGSLGYGGLVERALSLRGDIVADADGVICVGSNEYDEVRRRFPDKCAMYLPNGVDIKKFERVPDMDFRARHGIPKTAALILCVSRIDYQKNQRALVRLIAALRARGEDARCVCVGFITSAPYEAALRADIAQAKLDSYFTVIPGLDPESDELRAAYRAADVFALPSVHEPFGIVVLEAWSAGVPAMVSDVGGLRALVEDGRTGVRFDAADTASMCDAYDRLRARADVVRAAAAAEVRAHYSWNGVVKRLEEFYRRVCS